jgi:hypothetical protein
MKKEKWPGETLYRRHKAKKAKRAAYIEARGGDEEIAEKMAKVRAARRRRSQDYMARWKRLPGSITK